MDPNLVENTKSNECKIKLKFYSSKLRSVNGQIVSIQSEKSEIRAIN
jgi:hypothetical protein